MCNKKTLFIMLPNPAIMRVRSPPSPLTNWAHILTMGIGAPC